MSRKQNHGVLQYRFTVVLKVGVRHRENSEFERPSGKLVEAGMLVSKVLDLLAGNANFNYYLIVLNERNVPMTSLAVTMKGQVTLKRDLLQHLGIKPGERIDFDKLPGGELRVKAAKPTGTIDNFIGRHAGKVRKPITIEEMNDLAAAGWAGDE